MAGFAVQSVVLAKPADYLDAFGGCFEDNAFSLFLSSPARFLFFQLFLFIGIPSWSLCGGERGRAASKACWLTWLILRIQKILRVLAQGVPYGSIKYIDLARAKSEAPVNSNL